eukprot:1551060-Rhodomonas_salina.1
MRIKDQSVLQPVVRSKGFLWMSEQPRSLHMSEQPRYPPLISWYPALAGRGTTPQQPWYLDIKHTRNVATTSSCI